MDVRLIEDIGVFAGAANPFLRSERFSANVISVEVDGVISGQRPIRDGSLWILVEDQGRVVGAAMHTPPHNLFLPRLGEEIPEAVSGTIRDVGRVLPGVSGEAATVGRFLREWEARGGPRSTLRVSMRMYVLGTLRPPEGVIGRGRPLAAGEAELVGDWLDAFHDEANPGSPTVDFRAMARRRIANGHFRGWDVDGELVALAGVSPPAAGVARVGPVYTPPEQRRRGYGAAVTACVTAVGIDGGADDVVLYTDRSNPTSNSIYQDIGYVADHDAEEREFRIS